MAQQTTMRATGVNWVMKQSECTVIISTG